MVARNEKPSPHESSTDTIIAALDVVANLLAFEKELGVEAMVVIEAMKRLDKLETELSKLRGEK